ncbi:MAG: hypothetical protein JW884_01830 [Deltaproteobacteria bacterium]|nr:hypothetical protein [Deltaproteobacteria bacterium]
MVGGKGIGERPFLLMQAGLVRSLMLLCVLAAPVFLAGCGGVQYARLDPSMKSYRPASIGLLPIDVGSCPEASTVVDEIIHSRLVKTKKYSSVVALDSVRDKIASDKQLQMTLLEYLTKFRTLSYSDPELSRKIGEAFAVEALLIVSVTAWNYAVEGDEKVAKTGLVMNLVDAKTGKIVWKASHCESEDYLFIRPDLSGIGEDCIDRMLGSMPR